MCTIQCQDFWHASWMQHHRHAGSQNIKMCGSFQGKPWTFQLRIKKFLFQPKSGCTNLLVQCHKFNLPNLDETNCKKGNVMIVKPDDHKPKRFEIVMNYIHTYTCHYWLIHLDSVIVIFLSTTIRECPTRWLALAKWRFGSHSKLWEAWPGGRREEAIGELCALCTAERELPSEHF